MQSFQDDFLGRTFSFKFDETTIPQVKKQYDGFIQYWSNSMKCTVISYCGSLLDHFFRVSNALNNVLPNVSTTVDILSSEDVCDKVRSEWRFYQTEIIPEDGYLNEKEVSPIKTRQKVSY